MRDEKGHRHSLKGINVPQLGPEVDRSRTERSPVIIFSSDRDLASSLGMLLENRFLTVVETEQRKLLQLVYDVSPGVVIIDLPASPEESLRYMTVLRGIPLSVPVILLRNYRQNPTLDREIIKLGAFVFFKPADVEKLTGLISELILAERNVETQSGGHHDEPSAE